MPNLKQIVQKYLEENNYAGLCSGECGCSKNDLFPCGMPRDDCQAALWQPCGGCSRTPGECYGDGNSEGCYYVPVKYGVGINEGISSL